MEAPRIQLLLVMVLMSFGLSLKHSHQSTRDGDRLRAEARDSADYKPEKAKILFEKLAEHIKTSEDSADQKCDDSVLALRIISGTYPFDAQSFAYYAVSSSWISAAHGRHLAALKGYAGVVLLSSSTRSDIGIRLAQEAKADRSSDKQTLVTADLGLVNYYTREGDIGSLRKLQPEMLALTDDESVDLPYRQSMMMAVLTVGSQLQWLPDQLRQTAGQALSLAKQGTGHTPDALYAFAQTVFAMPLEERLDRKSDENHDQFQRRKAKDQVRLTALRKELIKQLPAFTTRNSRNGVATLNLLNALIQLFGNASHLSEADLKEYHDLILWLEPEYVKEATQPEVVSIYKMDYAAKTHDRQGVIEAYQAFNQAVIKDSSEHRDRGRLVNRLSCLTYLRDIDPKLEAHDWLESIEAFSDRIRAMAVQNPEDALKYMQVSNYNWSVYQSIPEHGAAETYLEGFAKISGIVKNIAYAKHAAKPTEAKRLYGDVSLAQIQARLSVNRPMVVFVRFEDPNGEGANYGAFLLEGPNRQRFVNLGDAFKIDDAVTAWQNTQRSDADKLSARKAGGYLYNTLLSKLFPVKLPPELLIVPDDAIGKVSFAALITPQKKWLIEDSKVTYLGAMRDVLDAPSPGGKESQALISSDLAPGQSLHAKLRALRRLSAMEKLHRIDPTVKPSLLATVSGRSLAGPRILHILADGGLDSLKMEDPATLGEASWLEFHDENKLRRVTARTVASWNLEGTQLAVLCVCNGANSATISAEGTGGFIRSLYIAGARTIIASLNYVVTDPAHHNDNPGDRFLGFFYGFYRKNRDAAASLQAAQCQMIKDGLPPSRWAGFICEGI